MALRHYFQTLARHKPKQKHGAQPNRRAPWCPEQGANYRLVTAKASLQRIFSPFARSASEDVERGLQAGLDCDVDQREKQCCDGRKHEDHHGGQQHFAAGRPDDFCNFRAGLLHELEGVRLGSHGFTRL